MDLVTQKSFLDRLMKRTKGKGKEKKRNEGIYDPRNIFSEQLNERTEDPESIDLFSGKVP